MYRAILLPLVKTDIREAAKWYNEHQYGLGRILLTGFEKLSIISEKTQKLLLLDMTM